MALLLLLFFLSCSLVCFRGWFNILLALLFALERKRLDLNSRDQVGLLVEDLGCCRRTLAFYKAEVLSLKIRGISDGVDLNKLPKFGEVGS